MPYGGGAKVELEMHRVPLFSRDRMPNFSKSVPNAMFHLLQAGILSFVLAYSGRACGDSMINGATEPAPERQAELTSLVQQDCGSCHGLLFKGGLGPPLTPEALKDKPAEALTDTILYGRNGTIMPPWKPFMTEAEAAWIVRRLQKGGF